MNRICRCYGLESSLLKQCRFELFQVETFPVVRGVAVLDYCLDVFRRRVTHIAVPAVLRIFLGQFLHIFVTISLGKHRCGGDGCEFAVSLDHTGVADIFIKGVCFRWNAAVTGHPVGLESVSVDKKMFRFDFK